MSHVTIQQFRAALAERAAGSATARAYRELTRRPEWTRVLQGSEWVVWGYQASKVAAG